MLGVQKMMRQQLADALKMLPQPKNEFEIVLPDVQDEDDSLPAGPAQEEDALDVQQRDQAEQKRLGTLLFFSPLFLFIY